MRRIWIGLLLAGVVPIGIFYLLLWTGMTDSLSYVSTTNWQPGSPSLLDLILLCLSMITWSWTRGFAHILIGAAVIVALLDFSKVFRRTVAKASSRENHN